MNHEWGREGDIIEGEYEIIEERYAEDVYTDPKGQFVETDNRTPYVTYIILGINIVLWLLMSFIGLIMGWNQSLQLFYFGAKVNELVVQGEYWRLFTAMFLHIGLLHLFFNSYALYLYGPAVEKLFGKVKFLVIYIVSGLMGSLLSYLFSPNPAAGASGAIFGLMGSLLYFRKEKRNLFQRIFGPGLLMIIGINLMYGFIQPGIDNWGHIGGLLGGFLTGNALGLYRVRDKEYGKKILIWLLILLIFTLGLGYGKFKYSKSIYLSQAYEAAQRGDIGTAKAYIENLSSRDYKDPQVQKIIEAVYIEDINNKLSQGQLDEALGSVNTLIDYYPNEANYYYYRGQVYEVLEDYEKALEDYIYVTETIKDVEEIWYRAGKAAYNSGNIAESREYMEEALKINPNYEDAKEFLDSIVDMV
ncbi:MAG: rhomboid family intramembrane serine protease [Clostridiales bacterium]|nr:rhomboid family intramembrane serine protease [Clostridiales bacterium]